MLQTLKIIIDFISSWGKLAEIFKFIKRNRLLSPFVLACIAIISIGSFFLLVRIIDIHNSQGYIRAKKINEINKYVRKTLEQCGDGTAISLGAVDIKKDDSNIDYPYNALFIIAMACDSRTQPDCIDDMHSTIEFYRTPHAIDNNSYNKFLEASNKIAFFNLRDAISQKQDMAALATTDSIKALVTGGQWFQEERLHSLWIKSVTGYSPLVPEKQLIYVATVMFTKGLKNCENIPDDILSKILTMIKL
jgi:hypothetical protein